MAVTTYLIMTDLINCMYIVCILINKTTPMEDHSHSHGRPLLLTDHIVHALEKN